MIPLPFSNPLLPSPSQDPWVTFHQGVFYALTTDGQQIFLRRGPDVYALFRQPAVTVWKAPRRGPDAKHLWAPELHRLNHRWYIYYAADDGRNRNHRLWLLEATGDAPAGPYRSRGMLQTGGWSIDATVFSDSTGQIFLLWSGWDGQEKGAQNLYIAPMSDPFTLGGPRVLLAEPSEGWERLGAAVIEGPAWLWHGGTACVIYSASASWTVHSCLGMLVNRDGDYLNPAAWTKTGPVLQRTPEVWGIGHCSVLSHEQGGVIFYHAKTRRRHGWRDRNIRAQTFTWDATGLPSFGAPLALPSAALGETAAPG